MDSTWIGILIGAGSLLTSATGLGINAYFRSRSEGRATEKATRERREDEWEELGRRFNLMCHNNQGRIFDEVREADRRIHARIDGVEHDTADKVLSICSDLSEIKGAIRAVQNSVNGGLEERIKRAVKSVLSE
jgi:hypothetical protein